MFEGKIEVKVLGEYINIYKLEKVEKEGIGNVSKLPFSIRILLENLIRHYEEEQDKREGRKIFSEDFIKLVANWKPLQKEQEQREIPFVPERVILQDFTGVPAVCDLSAMRSSAKRLGKNPKIINPLKPVTLVIDHSVQIDYFGTVYSLDMNTKREYERNKERYTFLKWAQKAFKNFQVVPPGNGIIHQVNLEFLTTVVRFGKLGEAFPDTVIGTDSHTTMVNGISVLGWGVGGIEAEAVMLGQPYWMKIPQVVGVNLIGEIREGVTATDLALSVTEILRKKGVVDKFVEFFGDGVKRMSLPDRATVANMAPEYGATIGFFPMDEETINFLRFTGRQKSLVETIEMYAKENMLWQDHSQKIEYSDVVEINLSEIEPSVAGPSRPQDRIPLKKLKETFRKEERSYRISLDSNEYHLTDGSLVIAAITSCTNTSNPYVLVAAGLLAKKAVLRGLKTKPWVKTSFAPGSRVVTEYLKRSGLLNYLEALGFFVSGYGCTTCIGNSGPLSHNIENAIREGNLNTVAVLSGNRNFEARIHHLVRSNFLMSPPLVVAFAIAGRIDVNLDVEPLAFDPNGMPVFLKDIWPTSDEINKEVGDIDPKIFRKNYLEVFKGDKMWQDLPTPAGNIYEWDEDSTYIQEPPFFKDFELEPPDISDIENANILLLLGDSVTTDHISPAGSIGPKTPAGQFLISKGVEQKDFNTYGARRGNHEVMVRGTFANTRIRNLILEGREEGGVTIFVPSGEKMSVFQASHKYIQDKVPLIVVAGKEYGTGSSRDWAAKGTKLVGVRAVLGESFERIHRGNLVGMGVLPIEFKPGDNREKYGISGFEKVCIKGLKDLRPRKELEITILRNDSKISFGAIARLDTETEVEYFKHGGILPYVLRKLLRR